MSVADLIRSAVASLFQHKLRSLLALMGVTLGALLLFSSLASGLGVLNAVNERLSAGDRLVEIQVFSGTKSDPITVEAARKAGITQKMSDQRRLRLAEALGVGKPEYVPMNLAAAETLTKIAHVREAWAGIQFSCTAELNADGHSPAWVMARAGALPTAQADLSSVIIAGRDLKADETNVAIVSETFLYQCGLQSDDEMESAIGSTIRLSNRNDQLEKLSSVAQQMRREPEKPIQGPDGRNYKWDFVQAQLPLLSQKLARRLSPIKIVGVYRSATFDQTRLNPRLSVTKHRNVLITHPTTTDCFRRLGLENHTLHAFVLADSPENVKSVEEALNETGFNTQSFSELAVQIRTAVLLITAIITTIACGALFISAIGITNTMIMNVLERRNEIAIMKAIGARDRDINRMFLLEGLLIGIIGGTIGALLGWTLSQICGKYIQQMLEKRLDEPFGSEVFSYPLWLVVGTPLIAAAVTTLATFIPARRAARLDPVAALREL